MTIRIVTDSTCDLTQRQLKQYAITVVPCYINVDGKSYLDGKEISRTDFYQHLPSYEQFPKTSAPGVGLFRREYERLADEGATHIISMHIHSGLSNLANAARMAAQAVKPLKVTIVETGQLAMGMGFMVLKAAQAAVDGFNIGKIHNLIKEQEARTFVFAALETVDYLKRSGRVPVVAATIADLLRIKPIVQLHKGVVRLAGQVRTSSQGAAWLIHTLEKIGPIERLAVLHTNARDRAEGLAEEIKNRIGDEMEILISEATPVLGVHVGPGGIGLACVKTP